MRGIAEWLESIGLAEYAQRFTENAIDLGSPRLTDQDLKDLGVLLGHRRKILRAIAALEEVLGLKAVPAAEPRRPGEAERRQLTVMFCDLVLHSPCGAVGPGGHAIPDRCVSRLHRGSHRPLSGNDCPLYGGRRVGLFRLSAST